MFGLIDRWTANIGMARKLLIAPGFAILLLSLMAPLALKSLGDQTRLIEHLTTIEMEKAAAIAALERAIPETNGELRGIIALAANSNDAAALIAKLGESELSEPERRAVAELGKALTEYRQSIAPVISMVTADVATAYMMS